MSNHNTIRTHFRIPLSPLEPKRERSIFLISKLIAGESENVCESCYVSTFRRPFHRLRIILKIVCSHRERHLSLSHKVSRQNLDFFSYFHTTRVKGIGTCVLVWDRRNSACNVYDLNVQNAQRSHKKCVMKNSNKLLLSQVYRCFLGTW